MSHGNSATDRLGRQAQDVTQTIKDIGTSAKDVAREQVDRAREMASDYYEQGEERFREMEQGIEDYVRENPIKSVLIAAGVGYLIAKIF